jgi:hypothetical protein
MDYELLNRGLTNQAIKQALLDEVNRIHIGMKQYQGYFDNWELVMTKETLQFGSGSIPAGSLTLGSVGRDSVFPFETQIRLVRFTEYQGESKAYVCGGNSPTSVVFLTMGGDQC